MAKFVTNAWQSGMMFLYTPGAMDYCHQHNLVEPGKALARRPFGIRVTLPAGDTMRKILGNDWERLHWYATEEERDRAYDTMAQRHGYYRQTDNPTQVLDKIVRSA